MGFARQGLWVMGYCRLMGYGLQIPAHQLGGPKMAWDFRGYGLSEAWVKRVSTVMQEHLYLRNAAYGMGDSKLNIELNNPQRQSLVLKRQAEQVDTITHCIHLRPRGCRDF